MIDEDQGAQVEAWSAIGNAIGAALEAGWTLAEFQRHAAEVWPTIVTSYAGHVAQRALEDARGGGR